MCVFVAIVTNPFGSLVPSFFDCIKKSKRQKPEDKAGDEAIHLAIEAAILTVIRVHY